MSEPQSPSVPPSSNSPSATSATNTVNERVSIPRAFWLVGSILGVAVLLFIFLVERSDATDVLLSITKFAGIILTGVFGVLALVVEYKDKDTKRITTWGMIAALGVVTSCVIGLSSHTLEILRDRRKAEATAHQTLESVQRSERLLEEISRVAQPIQDLYVEAWVRVPLKLPAMAPYKKRLGQELEKFLVSRVNIEGASVGSFRENSAGVFEPTEVTFTAKSLLFPRPSEKIAKFVLSALAVDLTLFKEPHDIGKPIHQGELRGHLPDLNLRAVVEAADTDRLTVHCELPELSERNWAGPSAIVLHGIRVRSNPIDWRSKGTITSIPDLRGSQLFATVVPWFVGDTEFEDNALLKVRRGIQIEILVMRINNREFWLREGDMKTIYPAPEELPYQVFTFPDTMEELINATRWIR
jgi:hypothetical protein